MKDNLRESLSVLMDNEGDELELRRVLKSLDDSPDAAEAWRRYHLARSLMRHDRDIDITTDLSAGIMARIDAEPAPKVTIKNSSERHGSLSFASGAAVAAAVSLMVITGVQFYNGSGAPRSTAPEIANDTTNFGNQREGGALPAAASAQPSSSSRSTPTLPIFQSPAIGSGLIAVGIENEMPMFMSPNQRQSQRADREQARLLQSYLERHVEGAATASGEVWMPLLRASTQEPLGQR